MFVLNNGHLYTYKVLVLIIQLFYVYNTLLVFIQHLRLFRLTFPVKTVCFLFATEPVVSQSREL